MCTVWHGEWVVNYSDTGAELTSQHDNSHPSDLNSLENTSNVRVFMRLNSPRGLGAK